jgi:hypothetical protein
MVKYLPLIQLSKDLQDDKSKIKAEAGNLEAQHSQKKENTRVENSMYMYKVN